MALASQITAAARADRKPTGANQMFDEALLAMPAADRRAAIDDRADAEWEIRRLVNRHDCKGLCDKPEHARDAADLPTVLAALGLVPTVRLPKVCTACGESYPLEAFRIKGSTPDGRDTRCSPCIRASVKEGRS